MSPKSRHNSWLPGYYVGLAYTIRDAGSRYVSLGYDQELAVQYFDFADEDQVQVNQEGVVIKRVTNALTGRTTEVRGDVTSSVQRSRLFQTYNTFRYHRLNLSGGGQLLSRGDFSVRAGLGVSYAAAIATAGYNVTLDGEIIEYGPNTTEQLYKSTLWSCGGEVSLAYHVGQRIEFELQSRLNVGLTDMMVSTAEDLLPSSAQIGAAVSYKF